MKMLFDLGRALSCTMFMKSRLFRFVHKLGLTLWLSPDGSRAGLLGFEGRGNSSRLSKKSDSSVGATFTVAFQPQFRRREACGHKIEFLFGQPQLGDEFEKDTASTPTGGFLILSSFVVIVLAGLMACHHLRLAQAPSVGPADWRFYGGTRERTNSSSYEIKPPLSVAWEYDASAGFSVYSAAAADNLLFVGTLKGEVYVIDIQTGHRRGVNDFGSAVAGTPIPDGALMYVALAHREESLIALNVTNGDIPWKAKLGDIETSPLLDGDRLFVTTANGKIVCLGKRDGMPIWEYLVPPHPRPVLIHSSPASDGNIVVFGCDDGSIVAVGSDDGQPRWRAKTGQSIMASPSIGDSVVYVGSLDSTFYAFHIKDGKLLWKRRLDTKVFASQAVGPDRVYVGTVGGILYSLNRNTGTIDWTFATNSVISAAPLLSGDILYAGCLDKNLYALDAKTGEVLWNFKTEGRIKAMPIAYRDFLIILEDNRTVLGLKQGK